MTSFDDSKNMPSDDEVPRILIESYIVQYNAASIDAGKYDILLALFEYIKSVTSWISRDKELKQAVILKSYYAIKQMNICKVIPETIRKNITKTISQTNLKKSW